MGREVLPADHPTVVVDVALSMRIDAATIPMPATECSRGGGDYTYADSDPSPHTTATRTLLWHHRLVPQALLVHLQSSSTTPPKQTALQHRSLCKGRCCVPETASSEAPQRHQSNVFWQQAAAAAGAKKCCWGP